MLYKALSLDLKYQGNFIFPFISLLLLYYYYIILNHLKVFHFCIFTYFLFRVMGNNFAKKIGVLNAPDVRSYEIDFTCDKYLILATDGLWYVLVSFFLFILSCRSVFEAMEVACLLEKHIQKRIAALVKSGKDAKLHNIWEQENMAAYLSVLAKKRWIKLISENEKKMDDITVVVVKMSEE